MIEEDAAVGFDIPIPAGANFVEVSMPLCVIHAYQQARQSHPCAANLPPMRIVERGTMEHFIAVLTGGVVFAKEDPQNPTILDEGHPLKSMLQGDVDPQQS
ncbi:MAG TPA: hypothetical protein QF626_02190 [Prochlorococcaceae cyanobacterium Fu_MAG_50]|nr:hypothetical protein [Prochlorococcaceae cyanobacterium Fu_MAG_50]